MADAASEPRQPELTKAELAVMDSLIDAANGFFNLPQEHPSEITDWVFHIHALQSLLMARCARGVHPELFPNKMAWATSKESDERP